jgi:cell division septation protein DedD
MSKSPRPDGEGYAVEVSLLKFQPLTLALAAACLVTLVALLGWLGFGDVRQIAASQPLKNHAANQELREAPAAIPNSATSQAAPQTSRADSAPAPNQKSIDRASAAPEPSPAGFAETPAPANAQAPAPPDAAPHAPDVAHNNDAAASSPAVAAPSPAGGGYAVQAGSFNTASEANERVSALRAAGFEARTAAVELGRRGTWYRVYSGRFASREEASRHDRKLRASGAVGDTLVAPLRD